MAQAQLNVLYGPPPPKNFFNNRAICLSERPQNCIYDGPKQLDSHMAFPHMGAVPDLGSRGQKKR